MHGQYFVAKALRQALQQIKRVFARIAINQVAHVRIVHRIGNGVAFPGTTKVDEKRRRNHETLAERILLGQDAVVRVNLQVLDANAIHNAAPYTRTDKFIFSEDHEQSSHIEHAKHVREALSAS